MEISRKVLRPVLAFFLAVALLPCITDSDYLVRFSAAILLWIGMAGCWNLMSGYTGYIDFGPVVYFGIGAYITGISMSQYGWAFPAALALSAFMGVLVALPMGAVTLRLKGAYFAIATFAFAETMKQIILEFDRTFGMSFFQGSHGITLPLTAHDNTFFYYWIMAVTTMVTVAHLYIEGSRFGYGLKAVKDSEKGAQSLGVNTFAVKLGAYLTSAGFLSIFGGIEAYWISYITPADVFHVHKTVQMVIMTLLGGMGTVAGPAVGASFLTIISEILGETFVEYYLILVGAIVVLVVMLLPEGLMGAYRDIRRRTGAGPKRRGGRKL